MLNLQGIILNKNIIKLMGIVLLAIIAVIVLVSIGKKEIKMEYKESMQVLDNPDRGFYIQVDSNKHRKIAGYSEEVRVILLAYDLEEYSETDISVEKLGELRNALQAARENHMAVIFRAAYGFHENGREAESLDQMGEHIHQIADILNEYKDNILVVQAGMLGEYGEWHSGLYLKGDEEDQKENRLYILKKWEEYLDENIKAAVRRPRFVREAEAAGVLIGRLGIHNDALLSTDSDMYTYDDPDKNRAQEIEWMETKLISQINGGEMPALGERNLPEIADQEFKKLHLSYLNLKYNEEIINLWDSQTINDINAKEYLGSHLGYRFHISALELQESFTNRQLSKGKAAITITLKNTGYAPVSSKYKMYITFSSENGLHIQEVECDDIYRISNGETAKVKVMLQIPESMLEESAPIAVGIKLSANEMEMSDKECIKLANKIVTYEKGSNVLLLLDNIEKSLVPRYKVSALIL